MSKKISELTELTEPTSNDALPIVNSNETKKTTLGTITTFIQTAFGTIFAPLVHTHTKTDITDFAHTHTKEEITDFTHTHTKSDVTDFAHTHTKSDITDFAHTHTESDITGLGTSLSGKQDTLIAGDNITITNNVISSTGGGGTGAVSSVNGKTGAVNLNASDVGALPDTTTIPTKTSDLTNDSGFITDVSGKEDITNRVTFISATSTDTQYASAKCVYDIVGNVETVLTTLTTGGGVS